MIRLPVLMIAAGLAGCAIGGPQVGLTWDYSYKRISDDTYQIHVKQNRFATNGDAEKMFRDASKKVADENHCRDYRIKSYSRYLENAFPWASIPVIEGEIVCLH